MAKAMGKKFPPKKEIENCCDSNPHGFGVMWNENGVLHNFRTLDKKKFIKKYVELSSLDPDKTACVVHARIKTHGSESVNNCHCWINQDTAMGFAHNGILSITNRGDMTDSETFFQDIFVPVYMQGGWKAAELAVKAIIGSSKFAFLDPLGHLFTYGVYQENKDKVKYSNSSYQSFFGSCSGYVGGYGRNYWDRSDWDEDDGYVPYTKVPNTKVSNLKTADEAIKWICEQDFYKSMILILQDKRYSSVSFDQFVPSYGRSEEVCGKALERILKAHIADIHPLEALFCVAAKTEKVIGEKIRKWNTLFEDYLRKPASTGITQVIKPWSKITDCRQSVLYDKEFKEFRSLSLASSCPVSSYLHGGNMYKDTCLTDYYNKYVVPNLMNTTDEQVLKATNVAINAQKLYNKMLNDK